MIDTLFCEECKMCKKLVLVVALSFGIPAGYGRKNAGNLSG